MAQTRALARGVAGVLAVCSMFGRAALAADSPSGLRALVEAADLSAASAPGVIVEKLSAALARDPGLLARLPSREQLLAVGADGRVVDAADGTDRLVPVPRGMDALLQAEGSAILLVHNHPSSTALSVEDLGQLENPGVRGIVAVGADGSVYAAFPVRRVARAHLEGTLCPIAQRAILENVGSVRLTFEPRALDLLFGHLLASTLHDAGLIDYHARLAPWGSKLFGMLRPQCRFAIDTASSRVRRALAMRSAASR